jgi:hypothetical protein
MKAETYTCAYWDHLKDGKPLPDHDKFGLHPDHARILREQCDADFKSKFNQEPHEKNQTILL